MQGHQAGDAGEDRRRDHRIYHGDPGCTSQGRNNIIDLAPGRRCIVRKGDWHRVVMVEPTHHAGASGRPSTSVTIATIEFTNRRQVLPALQVLSVFTLDASHSSQMIAETSSYRPISPARSRSNHLQNSSCTM